MVKSPRRVNIMTDTSTLAKAMFAGASLHDFNVGRYEGTNIPLRKLTGSERVQIAGTTAGARVFAGETWIADRFGNLGARQIKRLLTLVESGSPRSAPVRRSDARQKAGRKAKPRRS